MRNDITVVEGNLFTQKVECVVNPWNRNFIPWFFLLSGNITKSLKKLTGCSPFIELLKVGILKEGQAVLTNGGKSHYKIIHVASLNWYWTTNYTLVRKSVKNALKLAKEQEIKSIAIPLIGTGIGGLPKEEVLKIVMEVANDRDWNMKIIIVKFEK